MYHFIYKTSSTSGKYYIGRHSTKNLNDGYYGSGKWIRSLKDKSGLIREILEFCGEDRLLETEKKYLEEHVNKENCMNFNLSPVGFSSGSLNPAHTEKEKQRRSDFIRGDNNPAKRPEVREKMSNSQKGKSKPKWVMSEQGKKNISEARKGLKYSEEGKQKLSEARKKEYAEGKRVVPSFEGKTHSEDTKQKMRERYERQPKFLCKYCGKEFVRYAFETYHDEKCKRLYSCKNAI
jgi:hypothetical protein